MLVKALENINSWEEFLGTAKSVSLKERGDMFEVLTKYFLQIDPIYSTQIADIWLWSEIPPSVKEELHLSGRDMGIDLVARTKDNKFWAVQCKYRTDVTGSLTWREISTFVGLSMIRSRFEYCLIAYTGDKYSSVLKQAEEGRIGFLSSDTWEQLDKTFFDQLQARLRGAQIKLEPRTPRPHQQRAIENATKYFVEEGNTRGKLIMPCGAGKSLTAFWIAQSLKARTIILAVPSLALIQQTLPGWLREYSTHGEGDKLRWLCVCSDKTVAHDIDSLAVHTHDLGFPCSTNIDEVREWLRGTSDAQMRVIFTTYQSGEILASALRAENIEADLGIMDEAHKTVGQRGKLFTHLLFDENVSMKRRLFMTATEKRFSGKSDEIVSMDDVSVYGDTFEHLSFKSALEEGILSDYRIVTRIVSNTENLDIEEKIRDNSQIRVVGSKEHNVEPQMLASAVTLAKSAKRLDLKHSVSFHSSVAKAKQFKELYSDIYKDIEPSAVITETFHVSGKTPASERKGTIKEFSESPSALITNARCLTEGVDVPNIDCVLFADPRKSKVDIVQAVGRALRRSEGKVCGYILIPVISHGEPPNVFVESEAFQAVIDVIRALATNDERIIDYFDATHGNKKASSVSNMFEINADEQITNLFNIGDFEEHIGIKVWKKITPLSQRLLSYDEAIKFVHTLGIKTQREWMKYSKGETPELPPLPDNIPGTGAHIRYAGEFNEKGGWTGWLGTRKEHEGKFLSYTEASAYVRSLKLPNIQVWNEYKKSDKLPSYIPTNPDRQYGEEYIKNGKTSGWLGTGRKPSEWKKRKDKTGSSKWRSYDEAVKFTRTLGLKNTIEWRDYCAGRMPKLPKKPVDIPTSATNVYPEYKERGGDGSWLETKHWRRRNPNAP